MMVLDGKVAVAIDQKPHGIDDGAPAASAFEGAGGPVRKTVSKAERRRVHVAHRSYRTNKEQRSVFAESGDRHGACQPAHGVRLSRIPAERGSKARCEREDDCRIMLDIFVKYG